MVIKYKAKYIRDGEIVIDDTTLIELGTSDSEKASTAERSRPKSRDDLEQMIAQSEKYNTNTECGTNTSQSADSAQGCDIAQGESIDSDDDPESVEQHFRN